MVIAFFFFFRKWQEQKQRRNGRRLSKGISTHHRSLNASAPFWHRHNRSWAAMLHRMVGHRRCNTPLPA